MIQRTFKVNKCCRNRLFVFPTIKTAYTEKISGKQIVFSIKKDNFTSQF